MANGLQKIKWPSARPSLFVMLTGIAIVAGNIGILLSMSFFTAKECQLFGYEASYCDYFFQPIVNAFVNGPFLIGFVIGLPVVAGVAAIMLSRSWDYDLVSSPQKYFLAFLSTTQLLPIVFFVLFGFMGNQYFLASRCSPSDTGLQEILNDRNHPLHDLCNVVTAKYGIAQEENYTNLALSLIWIVPAILYFKK